MPFAIRLIKSSYSKTSKAVRLTMSSYPNTQSCRIAKTVPNIQIHRIPIPIPTSNNPNKPQPTHLPHPPTLPLNHSPPSPPHPIIPTKSPTPISPLTHLHGYPSPAYPSRAPYLPAMEFATLTNPTQNRTHDRTPSLSKHPSCWRNSTVRASPAPVRSR